MDNKASKYFNINRPIVIIANSSFYLYHYRFLLLKSILIKSKLVSVAPTDLSSINLSKISLYIPWRFKRKNALGLITSLIGFIKLFLIIRFIKPKLIHSHTLKANLYNSIICSIFKIPCVLSFTGLGRLSKSNGIKRLIFISVVKFICFFSIREFINFSCIINKKRTKLIFQNQNDFKSFLKIDNSNSENSVCIYGSGLPKRFLNKSNNSILKKRWSRSNSKIKKSLNLEFIFCGRLLKSKGIFLFINLAKSYPNHRFLVFGSRDEASNDSITFNQMKEYESYKNIIFKGQVNDPIKSIDSLYPVLIIPSAYGEGMPRTIIEAFSQRIPVISSLSAACGLFDGKEIYISENSKVSSYKKSIENLLEDFKKDQLEIKLNNAYSLLGSFSEETIVNETLKIYDELTNLSNHKDKYSLEKNDNKFDFFPK